MLQLVLHTKISISNAVLIFCGKYVIQMTLLITQLYVQLPKLYSSKFIQMPCLHLTQIFESVVQERNRISRVEKFTTYFEHVKNARNSL